VSTFATLWIHRVGGARGPATRARDVHVKAKRAGILALSVAATLLISSSVFDQIRNGVRDPKLGCDLPQDAVDYTDRTVSILACCEWEEHAPDYYIDHPDSPSGVTAVYEHIREFYWGICMNCLNERQEVCDENGCTMQRVCAASSPLVVGETLDGTPLPEPPGALPAGVLAIALVELARRRARRRAAPLRPAELGAIVFAHWRCPGLRAALEARGVRRSRPANR